MPTAADAAVARWIRRELAAHPPRARSLVVSVWGDTLAPHGGDVWLSTLIQLLAPFGVNERLVRTSVFRLAADGWLEARAQGRRTRYRLTADGARRFSLAYRRVYTPPFGPWDGAWELVVLPGDAVPASERRRLRDELALSGFAALAPGVHARPQRPRGDTGLVPTLPSRAIHVVARDLPDASGASLAAQVDDAFVLATLAVDYRAFLGRFVSVAAAFGRAPGPSPEQAFVVRTLLVHGYRRVRLRDPQLPPELLPDDWPGAAAYALCRDIYRAAESLTRTHLAAVLHEDGDALLPALPEFLVRFEAAS
jgi:phenylacetic acid degradation operon negative regulatory protein